MAADGLLIPLLLPKHSLSFRLWSWLGASTWSSLVHTPMSSPSQVGGQLVFANIHTITEEALHKKRSLKMVGDQTVDKCTQPLVTAFPTVSFSLFLPAWSHTCQHYSMTLIVMESTVTQVTMGLISFPAQGPGAVYRCGLRGFHWCSNCRECTGGSPQVPQTHACCPPCWVPQKGH